MERVEPGGDKHFGKNTETPRNPAVQQNGDEIKRQVERKPAHWRCPKRQEHNEPHCVGNEMIDRMEAGSCGKVQMLLGMVGGMKSPHETPLMLEPVNPVVSEVSSQIPARAPRDRMKALYNANLQKSKLRAEKAKQRSHEQEIMQPAAVVEPVSRVLQESTGAILCRRTSGHALQEINGEVENDAKGQGANASMGQATQGS